MPEETCYGVRFIGRSTNSVEHNILTKPVNIQVQRLEGQRRPIVDCQYLQAGDVCSAGGGNPPYPFCYRKAMCQT